GGRWGRAGHSGADVARWGVRSLSIRGAVAPAECQCIAVFRQEFSRKAVPGVISSTRLKVSHELPVITRGAQKLGSGVPRFGTQRGAPGRGGGGEAVRGHEADDAPR